MSEEDKKLLLVDLSARLPYGVKFTSRLGKMVRTLEQINVSTGIVSTGALLSIRVENIYPYLRTLSSMTNAEKEEYYKLDFTDFHHERIDWLNAHHFDYRNLIEKGLALEAPVDMYIFKD